MPSLAYCLIQGLHELWKSQPKMAVLSDQTWLENSGSASQNPNGASGSARVATTVAWSVNRLRRRARSLNKRKKLMASTGGAAVPEEPMTSKEGQHTDEKDTDTAARYLVRMSHFLQCLLTIHTYIVHFLQWFNYDQKVLTYSGDSLLEAVLSIDGTLPRMNHPLQPPSHPPPPPPVPGATSTISGDDSADNASVNVENLLFGYSLGKHHRANIEVSKHTSRKKLWTHITFMFL